MRGNLKIFKRTFFILCIVFVLNNVQALGYEKNNAIAFKNINMNDGLSQSSVYSIFQDSRGYMWLGTNDGLNRYDGYSFNILRSKENDSKTITSGIINAIEEDKNGNLWIGTSSGLSIVDKNFKVKRVKDRNGKELRKNVTEIFIDEAGGNIWVGTENGIMLYDLDGNFINQYFEGKGHFINAIEVIKKDKMIVGTSSGLFILEKKSDGENKYIEKEIEKSDKGDGVIDIFKDSKGDLWISFDDLGVRKYTIKDSKVHKLEKLNNEIKKYSCTINSIKEDNNGYMWIGTKGGLIKFKEGEESIHYGNKVYDNQSLVNDNVQSIYKDRDGLLWIGTYHGVSIANPNQKFGHYKHDPLDKNTISSDSVGGIFEDEDGELWVGTTNDGLNKISKDRKTVRRYRVSDGLPSDTIFQVTGDNNGNILVGTKKGLCIINKKTEKMKTYNLENSGLSSNMVYEVLIDSKGYIWLGTRQGLDILDSSGKKISTLNHIFKNKSIGEYFVRRIFEDSRGNYWIGMAWNGGLLKIDIEKKDITVYKNSKENLNTISNNAIKGINEDSKGNIWISTSEGLNKISSDGKTIKRYTEEDGLANNYVYGILVEGDKIWISTNQGISEFDIESEKFHNYTVLDGLQGNEFNGTAEFRSKSGEMLFGGVNGITTFKASNMEQFNIDVKPKISKFEVFNNLEKNFLENIVLKSGENSFAIEFFIPSYFKLGKWNYEYKLEGFDKEWISSGEKNYARYTNIPSGEYVFKVRSIEKRENVETFNIKINKVWYKSTVAYIIYGAIIVIIILVGINYVKILEKLVKERTNDLNKELREKEKLYNEKLKIEKFRNTYLVNLSHELRTPLNVILSSEQLITELNKEDEGIKKDVLEKYMKIIRKNSNGLLKVINDLIDSSRINSGAYVLTYKKVDIVYLVEEVALSMKTYIESNNLELVIDPDMEELVIECAQDEIERCIINLISNAVKFTKEGRIYIGIKEDEQNVKIIVEDSGIGISEDNQNIIFDRFSRIETGISSKHCSSGIGLTLVKSLVELHKGKIMVESTLGKGSKFTIKIPKSR